jgi:hypothetical protein
MVAIACAAASNGTAISGRGGGFTLFGMEGSSADSAYKSLSGYACCLLDSLLWYFVIKCNRFIGVYATLSRWLVSCG